MKYLIVNADDLGASPGITRGILEGHARGIVTSASLMVDTPWSAEAATLARLAPGLSVGLHADLVAGESPRDALRRQYAQFLTLMGRPPTHLDSHHNVHRDGDRLACFLELSREIGLPLRGQPPVHYFPSFYGQWNGESHPEQVSVESLLGMLDGEIAEGITELSCHPGYVDARAPSVYAVEREVELRTLCDPRARSGISERGITLVSYHDLGRFAAIPVAP
jgi:chitin disaccharide deacetylase